MKIVSRLTAAAVLISILPVGAQGSASPPISNWSLEPSNTGCIISRSYGSLQSPTVVGLKAMGDGDGLQLAIIRAAYRKDVDQSPTEIVAGGAVIQTTALSYPISGRHSANLINLSPDQAASVRKATTLAVSVEASTHDEFELGAMTSAWASLDSCRERLRDTWNVDNHTGRIETFAEPVVPLPSLFSANDYPRDAVQKNQSGTVVVQLLIDEAGAVKDCTLTQTSGITLLDSRSCAIIIKRAKFKPATDEQGRPIKSSATEELHWILS